MLIKRTKERSPEITPDNRGVIWGKELNGMATDEELYGQYLSGDETGLELLIKKPVPEHCAMRHLSPLSPPVKH